MDALSGVLDGPHARGAFVLRSRMDPPWSMTIQDRAPLTVLALLAGSAWVVPHGGAPTALDTGAVAVLRGPEPYLVADDPATPPQVVIHPGQRCTALDGAELTDMTDLGVRTWGNSRTGSTVLLTGTYQLSSQVSRRLLDALPTLLVVPSDPAHQGLLDYLAQEVARDDPGQEAVLDRLVDLLLIAVLRSWLARPDSAAPAWYRAHSDPVIGHALRLLHNDPAHPWTVGGLAAAVGVSRATLARRFSDLVGEPPMAFLTTWRLTLAADLLREPGSTLTWVARRVGYRSPFALSTAFTRVHGVRPQQHRAAG